MGSAGLADLLDGDCDRRRVLPRALCAAGGDDDADRCPGCGCVGLPRFRVLPPSLGAAGGDTNDADRGPGDSCLRLPVPPGVSRASGLSLASMPAA